MVAYEDCKTSVCTHSQQELDFSNWLATLSSRRLIATIRLSPVAATRVVGGEAKENDTMIGRELQLTVTNQTVSNVGCYFVAL